MTVQERYTNLRNEFINIAKPLIDSKAINEIANNYASEIDSKRRLSEINDLETLINVLEKRAVLYYDNLEVFHYIQKNFVKSCYLGSILKIYEQWFHELNVPQNWNMYLFDNIKELSNTHHQNVCNQSGTTNVVTQERCEFNTRLHLSNQETSLKHRVLLYISERLGRSWRNVVRHMGIREYQIEQIETKHPFDLKEQSYQALQICISEQNSNEWKLKLLNALEKGRRKDIREDVEKMIYM